MTFRLIIALLSSLLFTQTAGSSTSFPYLSTPQEQADFFAGSQVPKQSVLASLQNSSEYRLHLKALQDDWAFCRRIRYDEMRQWGRDHLGNDASKRGVVRYLFGGPDFLNASAFFPESSVMVLGGLEPVEKIPPPETLSPEGLAESLRALREALHTSLFCGYFITSEMKPELLQGSFRGVLPVLFTELSLTGNKILSVDMEKPFGSPGVKILYERNDPRGDTQPQTLYYFQADLSNGKECQRFLGWLQNLGTGASYLKAASYLLALSEFSQTREFLLKTSTLILQDDSGIPYSDFLPTEWRIQLFGAYVDPLPIFKLHKEPALETAYASPDYVGPLPFGVGYHVNANTANLLLATRNGIETSPSVSIPISSPPVMAPVSEPTPIMVRKALPVPVRKALPIGSPLSAR